MGKKIHTVHIQDPKREEKRSKQLANKKIMVNVIASVAQA
jgi:hypothetical protein